MNPTPGISTHAGRTENTVRPAQRPQRAPHDIVLLQKRLQDAVLAGNAEAADAALKAGARPDVTIPAPIVETTRTLAQHAVRSENEPLLRVLLKHKANPYLATAEEWYPPIHRAVLEEYRDIVECLNEHRVNWNAKATDPVVGVPISAVDLARLRLRNGFANWFLDRVLRYRSAPREHARAKPR